MSLQKLAQIFGTPIGGSNSDKPEDLVRTYTHWLKDHNTYAPVGDVSVEDEFQKSAYKVRMTMQGVVFDRIKPKTAELFKFRSGPMEEVLSEIDKFWDLEPEYKKLGLLHNRGILLYGPPGCHAAGTKVVMYDGSLKNVEDVKIGDLLMGPDSKPRTVLNLCRGVDEMFEITPNIGRSMMVNRHHILHLRKNKRVRRGGRSTKRVWVKEEVDMTVGDYLALSKTEKRYYSIMRSKQITYETVQKLAIDPYLFGAWLGDGTESLPSITTANDEIVDVVYADAMTRGMGVTINHKGGDSKAKTYTISNQRRGTSPGTWGTQPSNSFTNDLRDLNVLNNKHIPQCYLSASVEERLQLLAGLMDTDGYLADNCTYEITQKRTELAENIRQLALSLGFRVTTTKVRKGIKSRGFIGTYHRVSINGDIETIPVRLDYKKHIATGKRFSTRFERIADVKSLGDAPYYGFNLSDDHLYLTDDFVINHNSGKSSIIAQTVEMITKRGDIVMYADDMSYLKQGLLAFRSVEPNRKVVVVLEDADDHVKYNEQAFLHLLDGQDSIEGVLYLASTNYVERFPERMLRSGRFDKKVHVPQPPREGRLVYLKNKLKPHEMETDKEIERLADETDGMSFGDLLELVTAVYALKEPVEKVLSRLKKEPEEKESDPGEMVIQVKSTEGSEEKAYTPGLSMMKKVYRGGSTIGDGLNFEVLKKAMSDGEA